MELAGVRYILNYCVTKKKKKKTDKALIQSGQHISQILN